MLSGRRLFGSEVLPPGFSHCSGPYGIVTQNCLRVFFTSRHRQGRKVISYPFFIDINQRTLEPIGRARQIKLPPPPLGSYREHGVFPFSVFKTSNQYLVALATGWSRRFSVDVETGIGVFFSLDDGSSWLEDAPGPRFSASLNEPFLVCDASFLQFKERYIMAYAFGIDWRVGEEGVPERRYRIGISESVFFDDLRTGHGVESIPALVDDEVQAYPNLRIDSAGNLEMVFCWRSREKFRSDPSKSYKIAFARSQDGINWRRFHRELNLGLIQGETEMQCYPSFLKLIDSVHILYNGDNFGETGVFISKKL